MPTVPTVVGPVFVDDGGVADGPATLLWPSLFSDHTMWRHQVPSLRAAGWRTLTLDPPGHGRSPGPGRPFTMDECARAVLELLDASGVRGRAMLLGTSWGGFVAPRVALLTTLMRFGAFDRIVDGILLSSLLAPGTRARAPEVGADLLERLRSWDRRRTNTTVRSVLLGRDGFQDALPGVGSPAVVVSGARDAILPTPLGQAMAAAMPDAQHVEVPDAAHLVPLEAPDAANALILDAAARWQGSCR